MIDVENLVYDYPSGRALHGVGFVVRTGAVLALVGPNGAGKSTLMRCIAALDIPTDGRVTVVGYDTVEQPREVHAAIGYLPDVFGLYDRLSVRQSLLYAARSRGVPVEQAAAAAMAAAAQVGLSERMEQPAGVLSRGLRQRLAIAQTIVHRPRVLLLDEPAAGLDPEARLGLSELIAGLARDGMTIVVSSHILSELEDYCTEMLMLRDGRLVGDGVVRAGADPCGGSAGVSIVEAAFAGPVADLGRRLAAIGLVVERAGADAAVLRLAGGAAAERDAIAAIVRAGLPLRSFAPARGGLEAVYMAAAHVWPDEAARAPEPEASP